MVEKTRRAERRSDDWGYGLEKLSKTGMQRCFECGIPTTGRHHPIPVSRGGRRQLPMCRGCHSKAHEHRTYTSDEEHKKRVKEGIEKARERGVAIGAPKILTDKVMKKVEKLRAEGRTIRTIAKTLGISVGAAHKAVRNL